MANDKVCINSDIIENVKAMEDRAVLTQLQAYGDFLSGKFTDFQYQSICQSMEKIIQECKNILDTISVVDNSYYIIGMYAPRAEKIAHAMSALASVA